MTSTLILVLIRARSFWLYTQREFVELERCRTAYPRLADNIDRAVVSLRSEIIKYGLSGVNKA